MPEQSAEQIANSQQGFSLDGFLGSVTKLATAAGGVIGAVKGTKNTASQQLADAKEQAQANADAGIKTSAPTPKWIWFAGGGVLLAFLGVLVLVARKGR